jgi:hypothetical protein
VEDVKRADCLISFTEDLTVPNTSRGGRHVEFGLALALAKLCYIVGPVENVFHELADKRFMTWEECRRWIGR